MRSFRHAGWLNPFLILAVGALGACSSSSGKPNAAGGSTGDGGGTGGAGGGSSGDASTTTDAPKDTPASTDTQVSDAGGFDYPSVDGAVSPATMTLTSTALPAGGVFMDLNTCAGDNLSPPLTWTAGPTGTMSYAVVLTDTNNMAAHWVIWDIPSSTTSLQAALPGDTTLTTPVMAMQLHKLQFFGAGGAYRGPCPGANGPHTYTFQVTAIPTATLALGANPSTEQIRAQIQAVGLAHGDLSGTSSAMMRPADASSGQ
jgi:Raf kinase inhibitor-like YbhB/YbcL family protein